MGDVTPFTATAFHNGGFVDEVEPESGAVRRGRTAAIATGARWRTLGVPGEEKFRRSLADTVLAEEAVA